MKTCDECSQFAELDFPSYHHVHAVDTLPPARTADDHVVEHGYAVQLSGGRTGSLLFFPDREPALAFGRAARMSREISDYDVFPAAREEHATPRSVVVSMYVQRAKTDRAAGRRSVRALLINDQGSLVLIKRQQPGEDPYWTTPGGGTLPGEQDDDALRRELREELGATASIGEVLTPEPPSAASDPGQTIYLARLRTIRPDTRSGPEWTEQASGAYTIAIVPITKVATIDLKPAWLRDLTIANASALVDAAASLP